ncbi:unnamed protein product [Symbiodinium natans]|uniref:Uncharacterized protein n=1 Tax=Symbiodinium natans TaxID=878477 RepID=A0A812RJI1_9DINO|nr:unnamed protein product [Symbiodinium natans]
MLRVLALHGKLPALWGGNQSAVEVLAKFWRRFRQLHPSHAIYTYHKNRLHQVLPLMLHADEGETLKKAGLMVISWQSPQLFEQGLRLDFPDGKHQHYYVAWVGLKGDWPIQQKLGHLQRHFSRLTTNEQAGRPGVPLHDFSEHAAWRTTFLRTSPFETMGPLADVPQTASPEMMLRYDPFHTLHKGCFAELAGSGLVMIIDYGILGDDSVPKQLNSLYQLLQEFCTRTKHPLHMDGLTRNLLNFPRDSSYPVGSWFKAADTTAVLAFLEEFFRNHLATLANPDPYLESAHDACVNANIFLRTLYRNGLWLPLQATTEVAQSGYNFLRCYAECAQHAYNQGKTRYKLQPKYHTMIHFADFYGTAARSRQRFTWNILADGCQMDEDLVGKVATLSRAVNVRSVHTDTVSRYLLKLWEEP